MARGDKKRKRRSRSSIALNTKKMRVINYETSSVIDVQGIYNATLLELEINDQGVITPEDLTDCIDELPEIAATQGVIISGPGPIWLYAAIVHKLHATPWVATMDPRLGGAVVVQRHSLTAPSVGEVVELPKSG